MEEKKSSASGEGKLCAAVLPLKNLHMKIFLQPLKNLKKILPMKIFRLPLKRILLTKKYFSCNLKVFVASEIFVLKMPVHPYKSSIFVPINLMVLLKFII